MQDVRVYCSGVVEVAGGWSGPLLRCDKGDMEEEEEWKEEEKEVPSH